VLTSVAYVMTTVGAIRSVKAGLAAGMAP